MRGTSLSARVNDIVVGMKILAIVAIVIGAIPFVNPHNWVPFIPPNAGETGHFGFTGVMRAAGILFFAYVGFDSISTLGQETKNPQKTIPQALLISLAICVTLYVAVAMIMTGIADYHTLNVADPIAEAMRAQGDKLAWARWCVSASWRFSDLVSVLAGDAAGPGAHFLRHGAGRAAARPPSRASTRNTKRRMSAASSPAWVRPFSPACSRSICWATWCLDRHAAGVRRGVDRRADPAPHHARCAPPFRTPFMPFTPLLAVGSCLWLMWSLSSGTWWRLAVWLAIGAAVYAAYGMRHSKLRLAR